MRELRTRETKLSMRNAYDDEARVDEAEGDMHGLWRNEFYGMKMHDTT